MRGLNAISYFQWPGLDILHGLIEENWTAVSKCSGEWFASCIFAHGATAVFRAPCVILLIANPAMLQALRGTNYQALFRAYSGSIVDRAGDHAAFIDVDLNTTIAHYKGPIATWLREVDEANLCETSSTKRKTSRTSILPTEVTTKTKEEKCYAQDMLRFGRISVFQQWEYLVLLFPHVCRLF